MYIIKNIWKNVTSGYLWVVGAYIYTSIFWMSYNEYMFSYNQKKTLILALQK